MRLFLSEILCGCCREVMGMKIYNLRLYRKRLYWCPSLLSILGSEEISEKPNDFANRLEAVFSSRVV